VAPAHAAQEGAAGRGGLQREAQHAAAAAGAQRVRVVDAVAAGEGRHDQRQQLVADVGATGCRTEIEVALHHLAQAEALGQHGG